MNYIDFPQSACRFAISHADITPPVGGYHRMWGAARQDRSTGVHRPLRATVVRFQPLGDLPSIQCQILVALDLCLLGPQELQNLLVEIERVSDVDRANVMVTCSHTHAAGLILLERASFPGGEFIPDYLQRLNSTVARQVQETALRLSDATITYRSGHCSLAAQRDYWDEENRQYVCGFNPSATADDTLLLARVTSAAGEDLATLVNYACHPTTLAWENQLISPDFPGAMRAVVENGTGAPCVFLQGASGDLGPVEGFVGDAAVAERNGRQLGYAALALFESMPPPGMRFRYQGPVQSGATLGVWSYQEAAAERVGEHSRWKTRQLQTPVKYRDDLPELDDLRAAREQWREKEVKAITAEDLKTAGECRAMVERHDRMLQRLSMLPEGDAFPYQMAALRIGDAVWLAVQGEPYSQLQTRLRGSFPETPIFVASISYDWSCAYLPPADRYDQGIYQAIVAVLQPGCLEQVIQAAEVLIGELLDRP